MLLVPITFLFLLAINSCNKYLKVIFIVADSFVQTFSKGLYFILIIYIPFYNCNYLNPKKQIEYIFLVNKIELRYNNN